MTLYRIDWVEYPKEIGFLSKDGSKDECSDIIMSIISNYNDPISIIRFNK